MQLAEPPPTPDIGPAPWVVEHERTQQHFDTVRGRRGGVHRAGKPCAPTFVSHLEEPGPYPRRERRANQTVGEVCDEAREYERRCARTHARESARVKRAHKRALFVEFPGDSLWGIGHELAVVYRAHDLCRALDRYCYVRLHDSQLDELFGFANGRLWSPTAVELALYPRNATLRFDGRLNGLFSLLEGEQAPLVHAIAPPAAMPTRAFAASLLMPLLPWDVSLLDGSIAMHAWHSSDATRRGAAADPHLTRCFCAFVASPRFRLPTTHHATAYHLRTGFADVPDPRAPYVGMPREASRWWSAACPRALPAGTLLVSDAPGLVAAAIAANPSATKAVALGPQPARTRSWRAGIGPKLRAAADTVLLGRSTTIYTTHPSSFARPAVARSLCVRAVRNVDHPASTCRTFPRTFPRDLFAVLRDQPHCFWRHAGAEHPCAHVRHYQQRAGGACRELFLAATSAPT